VKRVEEIRALALGTIRMRYYGADLHGDESGSVDRHDESAGAGPSARCGGVWTFLRARKTTGHGPAPLKDQIWIALMWGRAMPGRSRL
jgi:hypothetical protein